MNKTQKDILSFFYHHPNYYWRLISRYYPLSDEQITELLPVIDWKELSENRNMTWNIKTIALFTDNLCWDTLTLNPIALSNPKVLDLFGSSIRWKTNCTFPIDTIASNTGIPWSIPLIEKYIEKLDFQALSFNGSLPWSKPLLEHFRDHWDYKFLSMNTEIPWNLDWFEAFLGEHFLSYFSCKTNRAILSNVDIIDKYQHKVDWGGVFAQEKLPWKEQNLIERWKSKISWNGISFNNVFFENDPDFFESNLNHKLNFSGLSTLRALPWSIKLVKRYEDFWNWDYLFLNPNIPWNEAFINYFSHRVTWGKIEWNKKFVADNTLDGTLVYDVPLIQGLAQNQGIAWNISMLQRFENEIDYDLLLRNPSVWKKAFQPEFNEECLLTLNKILL